MGAFYLGFKNTTALKISFLLAIPTLCFIFIGENLAINFQYEIGFTNLILISLISFLTAFFTIHFFLRLVDKIGFLPFVFYRLLLGLLLFFI